MKKLISILPLLKKLRKKNDFRSNTLVRLMPLVSNVKTFFFMALLLSKLNILTIAIDKGPAHFNSTFLVFGIWFGLVSHSCLIGLRYKSSRYRCARVC